MRAPLRPKKSLGQHFLRDDDVHDEILHWARLSPEDRVLEIGAGDGTLTRSLGKAAGRVIAVETDRRCLDRLRREFPEGGPVEIVDADILDFDLSALGPQAPLKVVGDLPYNIATAVLERLLTEGHLFSFMILMFQKEVGLRLVAPSGSGAYGSLSLATQYRAEAEIIRIVPPEAFVPRPKVDSVLLHVVPRSHPLLPPAEEKVFTRLVRAGFAHRRKTFLNSLARAGSPVPPERVAAALADLSLPAMVRAEMIGFEQFLELARRLAPAAGQGREDAGPAGSGHE